jgi:hypothetical protein
MHGFGENKSPLVEHLAMLYSLMLKRPEYRCGRLGAKGVIRLKHDIYEVLRGNVLRDEWRGAWIDLYEFVREHGVI